MAPKKVPVQEEVKEEPVDVPAPPKRSPPVWIYGINDHLEGPKSLPANFPRAATLREDYMKLCETVGAVPHPAFKVKPKVQKATPKVPQIGVRRSSKNGNDLIPQEMPQWGARKPSTAGMEKPPEPPPPPPPESEDPVLSIRSMLLDRISVHLLGLLLPAAQHIKVIVFSDCRLDVEMIRLLRAGFVHGSSVEALQIEWNPLEVPLPSVEDMEAEEAAKAAEAAAASEAADGSGPAAATESAEAETIPSNYYDLEVRERRRYFIQSQRVLRAFKDRLANLFSGRLEAAFEALEAPGDAEAALNSGDFQGVLEARLGISGPQVIGVFEVLDGPDFAGSEGSISLSFLRKVLEGVPDEIVREGVEDPVGSAFAAFVEPDCVLESVSIRASAISRVELAPIIATLKTQPWQLRILNLWDNYLCDQCASMFASALEEYRGLEYLGLGRNRITDTGLASLCKPYNLRVLKTECELKAAQEHVKEQQAKIEALEKAKAKAKPKAAPAPTEEPENEQRQSPMYVDDLRENVAEEEGGESIWVIRLRTEIKTVNVSENPIRDVKALEHLQMLGPEGAELVLRGCPISSMMVAKRPDVSSRGRRTSGYGLLDGSGWVLRML